MVGCSGSVPGPTSAASCYLVEVEGPDGADGQRTWRVALDLGSGSLGPLQALVDPRQLDAVLLSHLHPDHCIDLCGLYVMLRHAPGAAAGDSAGGSAAVAASDSADGGPAAPAGDGASRTGRRRVLVWGPSGTAERLARAYDLPVDPGMSAELDVREWRDGDPVRIGPLTVTPLLVNHPVEAYGLRVERDGTVLAYTGDTDSCPALTPLCQGAALVLADAAFVDGRDVAEGVHLSGRRAGEAVAAAGGVERLVLTHLPPWNDAEVCVEQARAAWDGPLDVARPGAVFEL